MAQTPKHTSSSGQQTNSASGVRVQHSIEGVDVSGTSVRVHDYHSVHVQLNQCPLAHISGDSQHDAAHQHMSHKRCASVPRVAREPRTVTCATKTLHYVLARRAYTRTPTTHPNIMWAAAAALASPPPPRT
jgi:hypothetical protein